MSSQDFIGSGPDNPESTLTLTRPEADPQKADLAAPLNPPDDLILQGTYVSTYAAELIRADNPVTPAPDDPAFIPQSTIAVFKFHEDHTVTGAIDRNPAGLTDAAGSPASFQLTFQGEYELQWNHELNVYEGSIQLTLYTGDVPGRTQLLYIVRKSDEALLYMLRGSEYMGEKLPAGSVVQGSMFKVVPVPPKPEWPQPPGLPTNDRLEPRPEIADFFPLKIQGTFVSTYAADAIVADDPLTEVSGDPTLQPQSALAVITFNEDQSISGKMQYNQGGLADPDAQPVRLKGTHELTFKRSLGVYSGTINLTLFDAAGFIIRTDVLHAIRRSDDALLFLVRESIVYPEISQPQNEGPLPYEAPIPVSIGRRVPAKSVVQGAFERATPG